VGEQEVERVRRRPPGISPRSAEELASHLEVIDDVATFNTPLTVAENVAIIQGRPAS
jgi:hypothetical protein